MKTAYTVTAILISLLGALHIGFTYLNFDRFDMDAVWFLGSGVAIVLAGFLNIALTRSSDSVIRGLAVGTNLIFLLGFTGATLMLPQPQVYFGALLFLIAALFSMLWRER